MMALGTRPLQLFAAVLVEAFFLAVISSVLGSALGLSLHALVAAKGFDLSAWAGDYQIAGIVFVGRIYSRLTAAVVIDWVLITIGLTLFSALYPALRTSRLKPLEAIRHV